MYGQQSATILSPPVPLYINDPTHHAHTHMYKPPAHWCLSRRAGGGRIGETSLSSNKVPLMCVYESTFGENHQN